MTMSTPKPQPKERKKKFSLKVFCKNCCKQGVLEFEKGTELDEKGYGNAKSICVELPNGKWSIAECPSCGSMKLNKVY